ncbi:MAG: DNA cytosine methyltransferase [Thermodesulfobacteriota bacterium]
MCRLANPIPVIDIFAGPGGLGEGFSVLGRNAGVPSFQIGLSIEKDIYANNTLKLRSFFRKFPKGKVPAEYYKLTYENKRKDFDYNKLYEKYPEIAAEINEEVKLRELGGEDVSEKEIDTFIRNALERHKHNHWILIGGPPCQAYSTAGRSRNKGNKEYVPENDNRHFLYKEYLRIIANHWPSIFVMENVKGILTSRVNGKPIFNQILTDLRNPSEAILVPRTNSKKYQYRIFSFTKQPDDFDQDSFPLYRKPSDFIIECEKYGIPQARHRVILLGIREDINPNSRNILLESERIITVADVINGLPCLRSSLSKIKDSPEAWQEQILDIMDSDWLAEYVNNGINDDLCELIFDYLAEIRDELPESDKGAEVLEYTSDSSVYKSWYLDPKMKTVFNSSTRGHLAEDLHRYLFASCFSLARGRSPVLMEFPEELLPKHKNTSEAIKSRTGNFADRFRVQGMNKPSTTIMSHISKDGHYYIHPDPAQCRSLTVREAARLQTFPDNYIFTGPRTQQYVQVGNAVPPLLALQLAKIVLDILKKN